MSAALDETKASNELTADDIAMLREVDARGREAVEQDPELARVLLPAAIVASLREWSEGKAVTPMPPQGCAGGCRAIVPTRGAYCDNCTAIGRQRERARLLAKAYKSVGNAGGDGWDLPLAWCRADTDEYAAATRRALEAARRFQDAIPARIIANAEWGRGLGSLVILGPTRIGKTKTAVAIAHRALDRALAGELDRDAFFFAAGIRFVSGLRLARARIESRYGTKDPIVELAERASLLILDEIGYEEEQLAIRDLVYARCEDRRKYMIATTGLTWKELDSRYGRAFCERLKESGRVIDLHQAAANKAA